MSRPKYQEIVEALAADIREGRALPGDKLPSEAALVRKFDTSRITVGRALRELRQMNLIDRIAGSGTYVKQTAALENKPLLFGLLIPDLGETDIFEPICRGIAEAPEASDHALLWGHADRTAGSKVESVWKLCGQFIQRNVSGVFFAPLEFEHQAEKTNSKILAALGDAGIPVVLLDRRLPLRTARNRPDLVGLNNRQAGYVATEHLVELGCRRIAFLSYHGSESTIAARMAGYREALRVHGLPSNPLDELLPDATESVDAFVCVNDRVAAQLMHIFLGRRVRVPEDIKIVGIDDVSYASLLPVPLTTVRQPCRAIGEAALATMLQRLERPKAPARDVLLDGELVIRRSSGTTGAAEREQNLA